MGQLAKTDLIDARLLAHLDAVVALEPTPVCDRQDELRADLGARRRQPIAMIVAEKNRLAMASGSLRREIEGLVGILERGGAHLVNAGPWRSRAPG